MTSPATDLMVDTWERQWLRCPEQFVREGSGLTEIPDHAPIILSIGNARSLLARIRAEQAEKATARDRAILECLNALNKVAAASFIIPDGVPACIKAVLALLTKEEEQ